MSEIAGIPVVLDESIPPGVIKLHNPPRIYTLTGVLSEGGTLDMEVPPDACSVSIQKGRHGEITVRFGFW